MRSVLSIVIMGLLGCGTPSEGGESRLRDMRSVDEFREIFNRDAGRPRLVLLLSPT